jgi:hypothetical protein
MINNQQRLIFNTDDVNISTSVTAKSLIVPASNIDSDVSDRRDIREALYTGIFKRHRKTILVLGSFLKMLKMNRNINNYASIKANNENDENDE